MKKKNSKENRSPAAVTPEKEETKTQIRIQKADMAAGTSYDYRRLEQENPQMLPCVIEEEKETLCMKFDTEGMMPFEQLKKEDKIKKMEILLQTAELEKLYMNFEFSLQPDNLYYDRLGKVKIRKRDIIPGDDGQRKQQFLNMYQALIGYIMEGSRPYGDYLSGGAGILRKKEEYVRLMEPETLEEENRLLAEMYENARAREQKTTLRVDRKSHRALTVYTVISVLLLAGLLAACAYSYLWYIPRQEKMTAASDAFLQKDYITVIDSLRDFDLEEMERPQKYILATAYIQGQAVDTFSTSDKEAILSKITYQANETVLDYWICLGRLEVTEAEDLAMKMSDDQLLLYAYMQELDSLDKDNSLSGEQKNSRKQELMQQIQSIADNLGISYEEEESGQTEQTDQTQQTGQTDQGEPDGQTDGNGSTEETGAAQ